MTTTEAARKVRAALRAAFSQTKFSVTSLSSTINIEWEDTGPSLDELNEALKAARLVEVHQHWDGREYLEVDGHDLWCNRYNTAGREAAQRDFERRRQQWEAQRKSEQEAVDQARKAKRNGQAAVLVQRQEHSPDPTVFEAFERLRQRAEAEISGDGERRPSWAPPLILDTELAEACSALGYLAPDDKLVGRLWAQFAAPKRSGRVLREKVSNLPLLGISCRGFQLFAGGSRQSTSAILFEAQRLEDGTWQFGPRVYPTEYYSPQQRKWENLVRERTRLGYELAHDELSDTRRAQADTRLATVISEIEAIDAQDAAEAEKHHQRQRLKQRTLELARVRVLDFVGAPDAQMQLAGRLCGHCCNCWKALTDPVSLERGIGPDCYQNIIGGIRRMAANGRRLEVIAALAGMPIEFVRAVVSEASSMIPPPEQSR
jgi:hypothetical protein